VSKTRNLALFAAAYFISVLLITAPASLLDLAVQQVSNERLSLANSQGTIWHGSTTPVLHIGENASIPLHTLSWNVRPLALLRGQLNAALSWDESVTPMELTLSRQSVTLTPVLLPLPAEVLGELSPYLRPARLGGSLLFESPQLSYSDHHLLGNARTRWSNVSSAMSAVQPLGDYQIDIVAKQDSLSAALTTLNGALLLEGQGNWSPTQKFHFNGTAHAAPESQAMLGELLNNLGPEIAPGIYRISL